MPIMSSKEINDLFDKVDYPTGEEPATEYAEYELEKTKQHLKQYILQLVGK